MRPILFAQPPKGRELREALPFIEQVWREYVGDDAYVMLGWGTEPLAEQWQSIEIKIGDLSPRIADWETAHRLKLGVGDVHIQFGTCEIVLCHEGDIHLESANPGMIAVAQSAFVKLGWRCVLSQAPSRPGRGR